MEQQIIDLQNALRNTNYRLNSLRMNLNNLDVEVMTNVISKWINENKQVLENTEK